MNAASQRFGWYLAVLQLFFTLCWTVYAIYLPKLAATAGIAPGAVILLLMLDQAIFTVCDFATGIAADKVTRVIGRLGVWVAAATALSCAAFIALPFVAAAGAPLLIAVTVVWTVTSSALRAPPLMLLGKYAAKPSIPFLSSLAMLGYGIAGALAPYLAVTLRDVDPRMPFAVASLVLVLTTLGMISAERRLASAPQPAPQPAGARLRHPDDAGYRLRAGHDRAGARLSDAFRARQRAVVSALRQAGRTAMADAGVLDRLQHFDVPGQRASPSGSAAMR